MPRRWRSGAKDCADRLPVAIPPDCKRCHGCEQHIQRSSSEWNDARHLVKRAAAGCRIQTPVGEHLAGNGGDHVNARDCPRLQASRNELRCERRGRARKSRGFGAWRSLRTLIKRYQNFEQVTDDALVFATNKLKLELSADKRRRLLAQYFRLDAFADVVGAMQGFRQLGIPLAMVSNGTPKMLIEGVKHAGIAQHLDHLVSVDSVKAFKTDSRIYLAGAKALKMNPGNICFVSSHSWDVIGAVSVGYVGFWVNRSDDPVEELGVPLPNQGKTLNDAARFVKQSLNK